MLLYNLLDESRDALDPEVPLIFGAGTLTGCGIPSAYVAEDRHDITLADDPGFDRGDCAGPTCLVHGERDAARAVQVLQQ